MRVELAETAGFCFGVDRAVSAVYQLLEEGKRAATLGAIIHNPQVTGDLADRGVVTVTDPAETPEGCTLVIRSHGVPREVEERIEQLGIPCVDATCPFVKKIHSLAAQAGEQGRVFLLAGDRDHPEVQGIMGHCKGENYVVKNSEELVTLLKNHPDMNALVLRKVGNTLRGSVFAQILWAIGELGLADEFEATVSPMEITRKATGQKILFRGADDPLKAKSVKPVHGYIGILWFEELDQFAGDEECRSLQQSAIRGGDRAYIFKSFNPPKTKNNWANKYVDQPKENRLVSHTDYRSVPAKWLGKAFLEEAEYLKEVNPTAYEHEYLGIPNGNGGMVFENVVGEEITDEQIRQFDRVLNGVDWGYYPDPWAFNRVQYDAARRTLYIFDELRAYKKGNRETADLLLGRGMTRDDRITADSAEPKSVSDYQKFGLRCLGAEKGPGSVEYSMKWLQSLVRIVIDPRRCPHTYEEFTSYEYERTKAGEIMSGYPDANNHHIDAVRYATERVWKKRGQ